MWIERGNTKHTFDSQYYSCKDSILSLKTLGIDKTVCPAHVIHKFLRPEDTIRTN